MKKIFLVPAILGVMGIGGVVAVAGGHIIGSANSSDKLPTSEIEKKALAEVNGTITDIELETEGLKSVYEVEVITADTEYDLKFDAVTGELLKKKEDTLDDDDLNKLQDDSSTNALGKDDDHDDDDDDDNDDRCDD